MTDLEQYLEIYGDELRPLSQRIGELLAGQNPGVVTGVLADCCARFILGPSIHDAFRSAALRRQEREESDFGFSPWPQEKPLTAFPKHSNDTRYGVRVVFAPQHPRSG
jgi:hypothetical protein